jgi:formylglycine-generating enzyme required for sulfatase activity
LPVAALEQGQDILATGNGAALQDFLDKNADKHAAVEARAKALGLGVLAVRAGPKGQETDRLLVSGGGKGFTDCATGEACPEMAVIPASPPGFMIGSPPEENGHQEDEKQHAVTVGPFAIGRFEVTVAEYKRCVAAGGCNPPEWLEPGGQHNIETGTSGYYRSLGTAVTGDGQPIVGVSHDDANAYAKWLAETTGKGYRLPSEAEWELAARAGTAGPYWWGDDAHQDGKVWAACRECGSEWDGKAPAPANAFSANPWGLYNVHGNVWEWVADFYCEDYAAGPADGSARLADDCPKNGGNGLKVLRGGSVYYKAELMRAAMRVRNVRAFRNFSVGFRVARSLVN